MVTIPYYTLYVYPNEFRPNLLDTSHDTQYTQNKYSDSFVKQ